ncbi:exportin-2-like isoform X2 [Paramacrobiotus metropolitanus]|uniref:exportin-2-like isoform X2 n=1 Tax=Paramacrobiotus metropolitanus TaxID=2943436 RepID=UPI0024458AAD|nr:exportin-2-like isoform X2 [Paramacrobiotus metropolitanus]
MANNGDLTPQCLQLTLLPDVSRRQDGQPSLQQLQQSEDDVGQRLVSIIDDESCDVAFRLSAALALHHYVQKHWPAPDKTATDLQMSAASCEFLKQHLVPLMNGVPQIVRYNISETIGVIARIDFPEKWRSLLPDLTAVFDTGEIDPILASLRTAHGLFKHYRTAAKSTALWEEILHVQRELSSPLTWLFEYIVQHIRRLEKLPTGSVKKVFQILLLGCQIYHSLIFQEVPGRLVAQLGGWLPAFDQLLHYVNYELRSGNEDQPGVLQCIKAEICEILSMLLAEIVHEVAPYAASFVQTVVTLLKSCTPLMRDDRLVCRGMEFLSRALAQNTYKYLDVFGEQGLLEDVCERIVVPNIQMRDSDVNDLAVNPEEFIRRDIEGFDIHTRRRTAADLLRAARTQHQQRTTQCVLSHVENLLTKDSQRNWKHNESAIFLVATLAAKDSSEEWWGAAMINPHVDVVKFGQQYVLPHILDGPGDHVVLLAACLKFVAAFAAQLPVELLMAALPAVVGHLDSAYSVVHTYAAHCLQRLFSLTDPTTGRSRLSPAQVRPFLDSMDGTPFNSAAPNTLFSRLLAYRPLDTEHPGGRLDENEYTMKCIMRALAFFQLSGELVPHLQYIIPQLLQRIDYEYAVQNPGYARYDHYLFESLALCIGVAARADEARVVEMLEAELLPTANHAVENSVAAFLPYLLQLLARLLETRAGRGDIPDAYLPLLDRLLDPQLLRGNETLTASLVRLVGAYFEAGPAQVVGRLEAAFGLFAILVSNEEYDHEGFNLLRSIIDSMPRDSLQAHLENGICRPIFQRLTDNETDLLVESLVPSLYLMVVRLGAATFIGTLDAIQPDYSLFAMLLEHIMLPDVLTVRGTLKRKLCMVGCVALLSDVLGGPYNASWSSILETCVKLSKLPEKAEMVENDEHLYDLQYHEDHPRCHPVPNPAAAACQLLFARKAEKDYVSHVDVAAAKRLLATHLELTTVSQPAQ